jgi:hypothetical protein
MQTQIVEIGPAALLELSDLAGQRAAGIGYPTTVNAWRWLYRKRRERGLENAFRTIGRRVLLDPQAYLSAVREQPAP